MSKKFYCEACDETYDSEEELAWHLKSAWHQMKTEPEPNFAGD
jgi:hypothetical protein